MRTGPASTARRGTAALLSRHLLFAWGASLGLPDIALSLGGVVRVRLDDLMVLILCTLLAFAGGRRPSNPRAEKVLWAWWLVAGYCALSVLVMMSYGVAIDWYPIAKMVGTVVLLFALTRIIRTPEQLDWLLRGLALAAVLWTVQLAVRYEEIVRGPDIAVYSEFKEALSFGTWNPNTVGAFAIPLSFSACLGWVLSKKGPFRKVFLAMTVVCASIPVFILARGPSAGMLLGWMTCLFFARAVRLRVLLLVAGVLFLGYAWMRYTDMGASAANIDLRTGEGFSGRYTLWSISWDLFLERPMFGWGFSSEGALFKERLGKGMPHSVYFSALVELGLLGFLFYLNALLRTFLAVWRIPSAGAAAAWMRGCLLGSLTGLAVSGASQGAVWMKPWVLALSLAIICVRLSRPVSGTQAVR